MKIAVYFHSKKRDTSSATILFNTTIELAKLGNHVDVYTPSKLDLKYDTNLPIRNYYPVGLAQKFNASSGWGLIDVFIRIYRLFFSEYDIIYCYAGHRPSSLFPAIVAKYLFKTLIIEEWWEWYGKGGLSDSKKGIRGAIISNYDNLFELRSKSIYDGVVCISNSLQKRLDRNVNSIVLHGAINDNELYRIGIDDARLILNMDVSLILIGLINVGYDDHEDNLPFLNAFKKVSKDQKKLRLFITGDKSYIKSEIKTIIENHQLINPGWLNYEQYSIYLNSCDFFVLPFPPRKRNMGRWPNKISDFLFIGRPIVSNPTGDVGNLLKSLPNGILCKNSSDAYENIMYELLSNKSSNNDFSNNKIPVYNFKERVRILVDFFKSLQSDKI